MNALIHFRLLAAALPLPLLLITSNVARAQAFTMYGAEFAFDGHFSQVDVANASLKQITPHSGGFYAGMDFEPKTRTLWASSGSFLYTVDPASGRPLTMRMMVGASDIYGVSFAPDGALYGVGGTGGILYKIDTATASATFIGTSGQNMFGLEFGPDGALYGCGFNLYKIDPSSGAATDLGRLVTGDSALFGDLDFAPNGVMFGVTDQITSDSLYRIDLATATATLIGITGGDLGSIASVPEPSTLALLALGSCGLICFARAAGPRKAAESPLAALPVRTPSASSP